MALVAAAHTGWGGKDLFRKARAYFSLAPQLKSSRVSRATKARLYTSIIRPVMTYGAETWSMSADSERRLAVAENDALRRVAGPVFHESRQRWGFRNNKEIRELSGVQPILNATKKIRLQYHGHLARGSAPAPTRAMLETSPHAKGSRPRGPPPRRLRDQVAKDAAALGIEDWREEAQDRTEWRNNTKRILDFPDPYEERRVQAKRRKAEREAAREAAREHADDPA
ncbi:Putative uncharacterized transposon-derived protein [Frankliniella fusca]|uniref:Uncharacterized transposon-derived protein n=1 Tax=Frankliniella fusca TaxID=407009 RepID=A0AAE1HKK6_9NEOP|nr:Putative uncharacterized transposon-derived protein [Frankliniella fusca]